MAALDPLDWAVLAAYGVGVVALGLVAGRGQRTDADYFLAGRRARRWTVGLSIMATQAGAISLISAPAFVALAPGGGLKWLQFELAVPVAMMFLTVTLVPMLRRGGHVTVYEYLQHRYDARTRAAISLTFQVSRALATGVALYALSIVLSAVLEWPLAPTILVMGGATILYDILGGMRGVLASDVAQMLLMGLGVTIGIAAVLHLGGGWDNLVTQVDPARAQVLDLDAHGLGDGGTFGFWPMLLGGFFLYASYYGVDQSQAQRVLSARDDRHARHALVINGLLRFPFVLSYCLFGLLLAGFLVLEPALAAQVPPDRPDYLVPLFIVNYLPAGITGLVVAALLAATMSSVDSALNSLSAATLRDLVPGRATRPDGTAPLGLAKAVTAAWGLACTGFAFVVANIATTSIEAINLLGSVFFAPILAVFLLGAATRRTGPAHALAGLAAGVATNLLLWTLAPAVSWLWWNVFGFAAAILAALGSARVHRTATRARRAPHPGPFGAGYLALSVHFAVILGLCASLAMLVLP